MNFQTTRAVTRLIDSAGNSLAGGKAQYYSNGAWHDIGNTGTEGSVSVELLAANYTFSVDYAYGRSTKSQDVGLNGTITFQTGKVHSVSEACVQYYGGGWRTFVNNMELLPLAIPFKLNDGTPNAISTVIAGAAINIH